MKNVTKKMLREFFGRYLERDEGITSAVWEYKGRALATTGRVLLLSKQPLPDCTPMPDKERVVIDKYKICDHLFAEDWPEGETFNAEKDHRITCPDCKGDQWKTCECCGHDYECKTCGGEGSINEEVEFCGLHVDGVIVSKLSLPVLGMTWHQDVERKQLLGDCEFFRCLVVPERRS